MENEEQVIDETLEVIEDSTEEVEEQEEESIEEIKARLAKAEELANNYKVRAEKAEGKAKEGKSVKTESSNLSTLDIIALSKANIEDEDIDEVLEYASYKKIPVREALKSSILKSTLAEKAEMRKSAQAVNTGSTRRSSSSVSDDRLLADARKGILPESEEDIARLTKLKLMRK